MEDPPPAFPAVVRGRDRCRRRCGDLSRIGMNLQELANGDVGVETNRPCVRAYERAAENPRRPLRDIVPFQCLEQRDADFGLLRDCREIDLLFFAPPAESSAERHQGSSRCPRALDSHSALTV